MKLKTFNSPFGPTKNVTGRKLFDGLTLMDSSHFSFYILFQTMF